MASVLDNNNNNKGKWKRTINHWSCTAKIHYSLIISAWACRRTPTAIKSFGFTFLIRLTFVDFIITWNVCQAENERLKNSAIRSPIHRHKYTIFVQIFVLESFFFFAASSTKTQAKNLLFRLCSVIVCEYGTESMHFIEMADANKKKTNWFETRVNVPRRRSTTIFPKELKSISYNYAMANWNAKKNICECAHIFYYF